MNKLMHNIAVAVLMVFAIALSSLVHAYNGSFSGSMSDSMHGSMQISTQDDNVVDHSKHHIKGDHQSVSNHHANMKQSQDCQDCPPLHCQLMASAVLPTGQLLPELINLPNDLTHDSLYQAQDLSGYWQRILRPPIV
ncbi:hypothetical protein [Acinetobacter sp.]|uniref:hypothetical protein n=1 Tax=Acinetobacter sp. TaxID=472 RepID=UPI0035B24310